MNRYTITFYTTVGEGDNHEHPMAEVEIEAKNLEEAINLVKKGYIEIQELSGKERYIISDLKKINFNNNKEGK